MGDLKLNMIDTEKVLEKELEKYSKSFNKKRIEEKTLENIHDPLMDVFEITPIEKTKQAQYWGRELGALWEKLVRESFENSSKVTGFSGHLVIPDKRGKTDEPCDLIANGFAIDTKYRIGSGDSKFIKQFKENYNLLVNRSYNPVLLILREDNLSSPINSAKKAGWSVITGQQSFDFILKQTGFDLKKFLDQRNKIYGSLK